MPEPDPRNKLSPAPAVAAASAAPAGPAIERGLAELQAVGLYRLLHCITDVDLEAAA